ncbi:hypothetical protein BpHYR1_010341, partial [Brachionus plicatilis]
SQTALQLVKIAYIYQKLATDFNSKTILNKKQILDEIDKGTNTFCNSGYQKRVNRNFCLRNI